jgi:hypothetical protein
MRKKLFLPVDEKKLSSNGYEWQGACNERGVCHGRMARSETITGNADNLVSQGQRVQNNNEAYQAIYENYAGKDGYSRTQSYMRSFEANGKNKWLSECMQHVEGFVKDGTYYSCDGSAQSDLYNSCKTVTECAKYENKTYINETHKICDITAATTSVTCIRYPQVKIQTIPTTYPNCKDLVITQGLKNSCPKGYTQELQSDMISHVIWDDIRICTKIVSPNENTNCYTGGYYIATSVKPFYGNGQGILPKGLHGFLQLNHVYRGRLLITVVDGSGKKIVDRTRVGEGSIINLPYSSTQDQYFKFYLTGNPSNTGVLTMLVEHHGKYKTPPVTMNQSCPAT